MIAIPYGKSHLDVAFPYNGLLTSRVDELKSDRTGRELVEEAMASPIGTPGLAALAAGKKRCTIIISDHTRPVPSRDILPPMLAQLRQGNPEIRVTLLVATGFHRLTCIAAHDLWRIGRLRWNDDAAIVLPRYKDQREQEFCLVQGVTSFLGDWADLLKMKVSSLAGFQLSHYFFHHSFGLGWSFSFSATKS